MADTSVAAVKTLSNEEATLILTLRFPTPESV
jgi:hypothetical protein